MTAIEMFTVADALKAFAIAISSLSAITVIGLAGSRIRGAVARAKRRSTADQLQPRSQLRGAR